MYRCTEFGSSHQENGCCVHHFFCPREWRTSEEVRYREDVKLCFMYNIDRYSFDSPTSLE